MSSIWLSLTTISLGMWILIGGVFLAGMLVGALCMRRGTA